MTPLKREKSWEMKNMLRIKNKNDLKGERNDVTFLFQVSAKERYENMQSN